MRLLETLTPEQAREVDSSWRWRKPSNYLKFSDHAFGKKETPEHHTIFIPLAHTKSPHEDEVKGTLAKHGFSLHDYHAGLAKDKHGRDIKIGKVLSRAGEQHVWAKFNSDPARAAQAAHKDHVVAITRHPHHVAGMSADDHPWGGNKRSETGRKLAPKSCLSIADGCNRRFLPHEVAAGTHVAYLVHKDDKDIKKPLARIALKPYVKSVARARGKAVDRDKRTKLVVDRQTFGNAPDSFRGAVTAWTKQNFKHKRSDGVIRKAPGTYGNGNPKKIEPAGYGSHVLNKLAKKKRWSTWADTEKLGDAVATASAKVKHRLASSDNTHNEVRAMIARSHSLAPRTAKVLIGNKHMQYYTFSHAGYKSKKTSDLVAHHTPFAVTSSTTRHNMSKSGLRKFVRRPDIDASFKLDALVKSHHRVPKSVNKIAAELHAAGRYVAPHPAIDPAHVVKSDDNIERYKAAEKAYHYGGQAVERWRGNNKKFNVMFAKAHPSKYAGDVGNLPTKLAVKVVSAGGGGNNIHLMDKQKKLPKVLGNAMLKRIMRSPFGYIPSTKGAKLHGGTLRNTLTSASPSMWRKFSRYAVKHAPSSHNFIAISKHTPQDVLTKIPKLHLSPKHAEILDKRIALNNRRRSDKLAATKAARAKALMPKGE